MSAQPVKVLFLLPSLKGGGSERVFSILLRHLDRARFEPHLAVLKAQGSYLEHIPSDVAVHELNASRVRHALPGIVKIIRKIRPRTVLSTLGHMNLALTIAKPLLPNDTRILIREAAMPSWVLPNLTRHPKLWARLYRMFYPRADKIVCLSGAMVEDMAVNFKLHRAKLIRIYNPVDIENVRQFAASGESPYSGPGPHLLGAGRLSPEKGFDLLLSAMSIVRQRLPQADLTILGEGPLAGELSSQAERLGLREAVRFAGFLGNPWPHFKHAAALVLPSRFEGFPNVALEALALDTPVVAFDCPGAIGELRKACPNLVAVPPQDPLALAEAVISVCASGVAGQTRDSSSALAQFSVAQIVAEYSDLFLG